MKTVSIIGGSGYVGGELIRLLLSHPEVQLNQITSDRFSGKFIKSVYPNLRGRTTLKFSSMNELESVDIIFSCLPHGLLMQQFGQVHDLCKYLIDLSADFRLKSVIDYSFWYNTEHTLPDLLNSFVYGIPELHREEMRETYLISSAGCNATASILGLYPLFKENVLDVERTVIEVKVGSSEAGNAVNQGSHHPERVRSVRSYKPVGHRHSAEIIQELSFHEKPQIFMSATSIDMVRGVLATAHVFLKPEYQQLTEKDLWKIYRKYYKDEPFIRIIKEKSGNYRLPDPKTLLASNYCDISFIRDEGSSRVVILSAIDNLMKGAAGQAVQAFNIMLGFEETTGLEFPGIHLY